MPTERLPPVVRTVAPSGKQCPAVVRKRWPPFWTTKPDVQTDAPLLIELPPQNGGMSAKRLKVSRIVSTCRSMTPG